MDTFIWTQEYSVGVQLVDEQHQHFFAIANKLASISREKSPDREVLSNLFGELGDYALYHLSTEESFFRGFDYEDAAAHVAAHNAYRDMIANRFMFEIQKSGVDFQKLAEDMALYSGAWLQEHIMIMDKKFTPFFNQHGFN